MLRCRSGFSPTTTYCSASRGTNAISASPAMQRANGAIVGAPMTSRTEFAILGAGAIGSILGAHLARAGHSVTMLVRERRAAQLRDGLRIKGLADFTIPVQVLTDEIG